MAHQITETDTRTILDEEHGTDNATLRDIGMEAPADTDPGDPPGGSRVIL